MNMIKICLAALKPENEKERKRIHVIGVCQQNPGRQSSRFKESLNLLLLYCLLINVSEEAECVCCILNLSVCTVGTRNSV